MYINTQDKLAQKVTVDYANGSNVFATSESIRVTDSNKTGSVIYFSNNSTGVLIVGELNELLEVGDIVKGEYTNAKYRVTALDESPVKSLVIITQANPANADPDDAYGFSETIIEWPNTLT